jgi:TetR/AcrR family transcriptional regulator
MRTKDKIVAAAKIEFHQKGFSGARMQEIADRCGMNKALLHYHFTNKEVLFRAVLLNGVMELFPNVIATLNAPLPLQQKLETVVDMYIGFLAKNPHLPSFVLHELGQNPDFLIEIMPGGVIKPTGFISQIEEAVEHQEINPSNPFQVLTDVIGMCAFPFVAKPILQAISSMDQKEFSAFIEERKAHVKRFLIKGLFIKHYNWYP